MILRFYGPLEPWFDERRIVLRRAGSQTVVHGLAARQNVGKIHAISREKHVSEEVELPRLQLPCPL